MATVEWIDQQLAVKKAWLLVEQKDPSPVESMAYTQAVRRVSGAVFQKGIQLDIELVEGTLAVRAATLVYQLVDMWAGHWVAWKAAQMVDKRVGEKVV